MSFLSLYRKYRPEKFKDLIGQDQIITTLKNALKNNRVAHAYLFAGPRGTGKTSTAKVFAKSLNCDNPGQDFAPCGECHSCQRISNGNSMDVIEIDAASNRGIDEIRELREKVKFYPGEGNYKVYIIDEVHMLTKGAFNALLKTLEEPPESVVFILATTEPHEVITTIMSRCQRFDFTLLTLKNLKKRLKFIAEAEGYQVNNQVLDILARSARGGMRDAISLLDQAISFSDGKLSTDEVSRMLGRINKDSLKSFLVYLSSSKTQSALELLNQELESGIGIERFSEELIEYCRELLLIKECGINSGILEYSPNYLEDLAAAASNLSTAKITNIIDEFASLKQKLRSSARPRLQLEISVIKLSSRQSSSDSLEARLSELEFKLNNALSKEQLTKKSSAEQKNVKAEAELKSKAESEVTEAETEKTSKSAKQSSEKKSTEKAKKPKAKSTSDSNDKSKAGSKKDQLNIGGSKKDELNISVVKNNWARVLKEIRQLDISVQALLREGRPAAVEGSTVIISFPESKKFHYKGAASKESLVTRVLRNILNEAVDVDFQLGFKKKELSNSTESGNSKVAKSNQENSAAVQKNTEESEQFSTSSSKDSKENSKKAKEEKADLEIEELAEIFSGEIIEVDQSILENRGGS